MHAAFFLELLISTCHCEEELLSVCGQVHNIPVIPGLVWTIRTEEGIVVTAAQLQHRLPCWGYVFQEMASQRQSGRKVVLLGDTCDSEAIVGEIYCDTTYLLACAAFAIIADADTPTLLLLQADSVIAIFVPADAC